MLTEIFNFFSSCQNLLFFRNRENNRVYSCHFSDFFILLSSFSRFACERNSDDLRPVMPENQQDAKRPILCSHAKRGNKNNPVSFLFYSFGLSSIIRFAFPSLRAISLGSTNLTLTLIPIIPLICSSTFFSTAASLSGPAS